MFKRLNGLIKEKKIGVIIIIAFLLVISIFIAYELIFNLSGIDAIFGTLGLGIIFFMIISLLYGVSLKSDDENFEVKYDNIYIYIKYEEYDIKLLREQFYINNFKKDINISNVYIYTNIL